MIVDNYFYFDEKIDINYMPLEADVKFLFESYVEKSRHFIELFELYKIYKCNQSMLLENFILYDNDKILFKKGEADEKEIYTIINTLTINLVSSGKTLVESIETYIKKNMGEKCKTEFRKKSSSYAYDTSFSYRFLNLLRNYSQHGHIPVQIHNEKASFSLDDILNKPHLKLNASMENEMKEIRKDILSKFGSAPYVSYLHTIVDYHYFLTKVYSDFILFIRNDFRETCSNVRKIIINKPELVSKGKIVCYDFKDGFYHVISTNQNPMSVFSQARKRVQNDMRIEEIELSKIRKVREENFKRVTSSESSVEV